MPRTPTPPRKRPQPQQDTQNSMFPFFRKTDEKLPEPTEPKRLTRKDLEDQVASLNEQLSTAEDEKTKAERSSADAQHVNAELNGQVSALKNTCGSLQGQLERKIALENTYQAKLKENQAKLKGCEKLYEEAVRDFQREDEDNDKLTVELDQLKKELKNVKGRADNLEAERDKNDAKLKTFENLAKEVNEVHKANMSLHKANKSLNEENKRVCSALKALKQTTEEEIVRCKTECEQTIKNTLKRERAILSSKLIEGECHKAAATQEFLKAFKKRKLEDVRSVVEQSSAGASLPIADVVPCECDNGDRCVHDESVHQQPSSD